MDTLTCFMCKSEKHINKFYKKYSECRDCNRARGLERYYENKDKISKQQNINYEVKRRKIIFAKAKQ